MTGTHGCTGYELTADITLNGDWIPIGTTGTPFRGLLDGRGFTIHGLSINRLSTNNVGLFGMLNGASISALTVAQPSVIGNRHTGALVGLATNSTLTAITLLGDNSSATIEVRGNGANVGGLAGELAMSHLTFSSSTLTVQGGAQDENDNIGGILGSVSGSFVSNVSVSATVLVGDTSVTNGSDEIGLLIGNITNGIVQNSWARGVVFVQGNGHGYIGGLVGDSIESSVRNNWSRAHIIVQGSVNLYIGGLLGGVTGMNVENNWAGGIIDIHGSYYEYVGGFIGIYNGGGIRQNWASVPITTVGSDIARIGGFVGDSLAGTRLTLSRNYYIGNVNGADTTFSSITLTMSQARSVNSAQLNALHGASGANGTDWHAGIGADNAPSIYCDMNANNRIDPSEEDAGNRIWNFGAVGQSPAITCTGNLAEQRSP